MKSSFVSLAVIAALCGTAAAQTPLNSGPATPNQRIQAASDAITTSSLPAGATAQAQAQANGNFGAMQRPAFVGGQIQRAWDRAGRDEGVHVQVDCGDCVYRVRLREFMVTSIQLPEGVKIASADLGDAARFEVKKRNDTTLAVKPVGSGVDSSMQVYTEDGQVFSFYLRSEGAHSKKVPDLSFRIVSPGGGAGGLTYLNWNGDLSDPAAVSAAIATHGTDFLKTAKFDPGALRGWNQYKLWGDRKMRPEQVFRDDHFTYIQFGDKWTDIELPVAYVVVDGIDELVNTRVQGTTFIIESTHRLITLKSGQSFLCIQYKGD